jgi:hypothetical protein
MRSLVGRAQHRPGPFGPVSREDVTTRESADAGLTAGPDGSAYHPPAAREQFDNSLFIAPTMFDDIDNWNSQKGHKGGAHREDVRQLL